MPSKSPRLLSVNEFLHQIHVLSPEHVRHGLNTHDDLHPCSLSSFIHIKSTAAQDWTTQQTLLYICSYSDLYFNPRHRQKTNEQWTSHTSAMPRSWAIQPGIFWMNLIGAWTQSPISLTVCSQWNHSPIGFNDLTKKRHHFTRVVDQVLHQLVKEVVLHHLKTKTIKPFEQDIDRRLIQIWITIIIF